jgi:thiol-disulfide isomerase/thioredoxin
MTSIRECRSGPGLRRRFAQSQLPMAQTTKTNPRDRRRWRRWLIDIALVLLVFAGLQFFFTREVVRGPLPLLEGVAPDGTVMSSGQWRAAHAGEAFVVYVWATWCPICKTVEGSVEAVARDAPLLSVAMQSGGAAEVGRFLDARGHRWATLVDSDARLSGQLGVGAVPTFIFVDRDGRVRAVTQGYTTELGMRLRLWWARLAA